MFERRISHVATVLLKLTKSALEQSDFAGNSPVLKARTVITKVARLDVVQEAWDALEPYRLIRNTVVHNLAKYDREPPPPVKKLVETSATISLSEDSELLVSDEFFGEFLQQVEKFYRVLFDAWDRWSELRAVASQASP